MRQFWKAAGADRFILERSTYSDHVKYACLGGIVVATGLMAALAGGYAFYIIFEPKGDALSSMNAEGVLATEHVHLATSFLAATFGIIWGLIIFNLDRFIVASSGKGDGTEAITWQELKGAFPRILMGIIIAITISKPVEIRMFKTEIDVKLREKQQEQEAAFKTKTETNYLPFIEAVETKIKAVKNELSAKESQRNDLMTKLEEEIAGRVGSGKDGYGPASKKIEANLAMVNRELEEMKNDSAEQLAELKEERKEWKEKLKAELAIGKKTANGLDGLLERIKIGHEIAGSWITLFITLLFMAIELTPIFFKMMLIKSPYDFMSDNIKDLMRAEQGIEVQYDYYKDEKGHQRNLVIHHTAKKLMAERIKLIEAQTELNELVVEKWKEKERNNISENPDEYIQK